MGSDSDEERPPADSDSGRVKRIGDGDHFQNRRDQKKRATTVIVQRERMREKERKIGEGRKGKFGH